jgi:hypothetical protein
VLLMLDGVRWQEVFEGVDARLARAQGIPEEQIVSAERLLPNIHAHVIARGVALGAPGQGELRASGPAFVSLPGYQEVMTGQPPTGCRSNGCGPVDMPTLADVFRDRIAERDTDVAVISSWDLIERAAALRPERVVVSAGRGAGASRDKTRLDAYCSELLDQGAAALPQPGSGGYRPDAYTAPLALRYLTLARPRFLFIGLGDTDEHAHAMNYAAYLEALRFADRFVGNLVATLASMGDEGARTTLVITTDHGRARNFHSHGRSEPESGSVFVLAAGGAIEARGVVPLGAPRRLADLAPAVLGLVGAAAPGEGLVELASR